MSIDIYRSTIVADQTSFSSYGGGTYGSSGYSVGQSATTSTSSSSPSTTASGSSSSSPSTTATGTTGSGNEQQTKTVPLAPQATATAPQHASSLLWVGLFALLAAIALLILIWRLMLSRRSKRTHESYPLIVPPNSPPPPADNYSSPRDPDLFL